MMFPGCERHVADMIAGRTARDAFMNSIRILYSMEPELPREAYDRFIDSPCEFLMTADEQTLAKIWAVIQERQPVRYKQ